MSNGPAGASGAARVYCPPHRRAQLDGKAPEPQSQSQAQAPPRNGAQYPSFPQQFRNSPANAYGSRSGGFGSSRSRFDDNGPSPSSMNRGGPSRGGNRGGPPPFFTPQQPVSDRWKGLDDDVESSDPQFYDKRPDRRSGVSSKWATRDNRRPLTEDPSLVFESAKEKRTGINFDDYDAIPVEVSGNDSESLEPLVSYSKASGFHPVLAENIARVDYERPTPVQKWAIPTIMQGRDLMACAQTGSGKTAAFLIPIITRMLVEGPPLRSLPRGAAPVGLVVAPTRELAIQTFDEARKFAFGSGIRTVVVYGGAHVGKQLGDLRRGCDIAVATPGRLVDFLNQGHVRLALTRYLVFDEADCMLDFGFAPQIQAIVHDYDLPTSDEGRHTVMFSATFPNAIQQLAKDFLRNYVFLAIGRVGSTNTFIKQNLIYANEDSKEKRLLVLLDKSKGLTLIFVETKRKADELERILVQKAYPAISIHGDRTQQERELALQAFRSGECPILVATDVAARGLDISNIEHVINYDLPHKVEDYVHRIGRTGRAGNKGLATSLVHEDNNRSVLRDLIGVLEESQQEIPEWYFQMVEQPSAYGRQGDMFSFGRRGGRGGRSNRDFSFGSRDIRAGEGTSRLVKTSTTTAVRRTPNPKTTSGFPAGRMGGTAVGGSGGGVRRGNLADANAVPEEDEEDDDCW